jgi:hypothetical protein
MKLEWIKQYQANSGEHHWQNTWMPNKKILQNTKCLDYGMWKGILNARAKVEFNCDTIIGIECNAEHRADCQKLNINSKLYASVDDLPDDTMVDVIFLHGIISLLGKNWTNELEKLFKKVKARTLQIRHGEFKQNEVCSSKNRETNNFNLKNYNLSPTRDELIEFFKENKYNLIHRNKNNLKH